MTYSVDPPDAKAPAVGLAGDAALSFSIRKIVSGRLDVRNERDWANNKMAPRITRYLREQAGIGRVTPVQEDQTEGLYCDIFVNLSGARGPFDSVSGLLYVATLGISPYYEHNIYPVTYKLYRDGTKLGEFKYLIHQRTWAEILLLAVGWISLLTDDLEDAVIHTTEAFVADARPLLAPKP